ncbi:hypothetical protein [Methanococcus voltae]|uniref:Uncharacterized protein n=2 Tax=Methanococcus voltae TaxID=2188 RepID=A0A8J7S5J4_METVO|nr:hypothetical protein [Methanococcus voltae]MBP2172807.1 hypothetical protein [Methanococcus voltae]MBP2201783.1 hypothetical protein [Methanococcus voltae]MCS3922607.1 hypothetical protein [Methanococcus voltae PS]
MYINIFVTLMSLCMLMNFSGWDTAWDGGLNDIFEDIPTNTTIERNIVDTAYSNYLITMDNYFNLNIYPNVNEDKLSNFFNQPKDEHGRGSRVRRIFRLEDK